VRIPLNEPRNRPPRTDDAPFTVHEPRRIDRRDPFFGLRVDIRYDFVLGS
jgi:hypothetical protein